MASNVAMLMCSSCKQVKPSRIYTASQLKKEDNRRCPDCVSAGTFVHPLLIFYLFYFIMLKIELGTPRAARLSGLLGCVCLIWGFNWLVKYF